MAKIFLTSGTSWAGIPTDGSDILVECIGGGGNGSASALGNVGAGGGGGAYAKKTVPYVSGSAVTGIQIGGIAQDTIWNTNVIIAKAGTSAVGATAGIGGVAASCTPTTGAFSGGSGVISAFINNGGGGGGGAAGPNGAGKNGAQGGLTGQHGGCGGGGSDNVSATDGVGSGLTGGNGGVGSDGTAGGTGSIEGAPSAAGNPGSHGSGGGGSGSTTTNSSSTGNGGAGGAGVSFDATHGAGGGGAGSGGRRLTPTGVTSGAGGAGGLYGGGGGGSGWTNNAYGAGGAGAQGIIVITYNEPTPLTITKSDQMNNMVDAMSLVSSAAASFGVVLSDSFNFLADSVSFSGGAPDYVLRLGDSINQFNDSQKIVLGLCRLFSDTVNNWLDAFSKVAGIPKAVFDSNQFNWADALVTSLLAPLTVSKSDTLNFLADAATITKLDVIISITKSDSMNFMSDAIKIWHVIRKTFGDNFTLSDSLQLRFKHLLLAADTINTLADALGIRINSGPSVFADSMNNLADNVSIQLAVQLRLTKSDQLVMTDAVSVQLGTPYDPIDINRIRRYLNDTE